MKNTWLNGLTLEEWEEDPKNEGLVYQLHGCCQDWVLKNFKKGDSVIVFQGTNYETGEPFMIHCFIQRGNMFHDVRGCTPYIDNIYEGFEDWDVEETYSFTLTEFKYWLKKMQII